MIDFMDAYYGKDYSTLQGYDKERARQKAVKAVVPLIIENELTERQSVCLQYKYFANKSQAEIAEILKLSQPTVSRHISTAKDIVNNSLKYCYVALSSAIEEYDKLTNVC